MGERKLRERSDLLILSQSKKKLTKGFFINQERWHQGKLLFEVLGRSTLPSKMGSKLKLTVVEISNIVITLFVI